MTPSGSGPRDRVVDNPRVGGQAATVSARLESAMRARRLAAWLPPQRNLNTAIAADGDLTVRRAREIVLGNALATNAADEFVANAVGTPAAARRRYMAVAG